MPDSNVCPECGAALPEGAERCNLCGTLVSSGEAEASPVEDASSASTSEAPGGDGAAGGAFCNECGWENPPGANFCSRCGHELQSLDDGGSGTGDDAAGTSSPPGTRPAAGPPASSAPAQRAAPSAATETDSDDDSDGGLAKRVALVVGVAVLLVGGLYGWSAWSGSGGASNASPSEASAGGNTGGTPPMMSGGAGTSGQDATRSGEVPEIIRQQQSGEVPASLAVRADSLQNVIETRSGRRKRLARRQLGSLFAEAGLTERAAAQQWRLAQEAGDEPQAWERAGSLLYDWMASLSREDRAERQTRAQVARLAVDAYERVLESEPENYDVRTNLAVAYLDTNNPMRGISEIKRVLQERPDHVGARFNYGLMQVMIGRNATALEQFERVRKTASEDSPYYQQAGQIIERINSQTDGDPQDAPMPGQDGGPSASSAPGGSVSES